MHTANIIDTGYGNSYLTEVVQDTSVKELACGFINQTKRGQINKRQKLNYQPAV